MPRTHVTRRSLVAAASVLSVLWVSSLTVLHPLSPEHANAAHGGSAHCEHAEHHPIHHLVCPGDHDASGTHTEGCTHAAAQRSDVATNVRATEGR